jgi:peroxiredoxin
VNSKTWHILRRSFGPVAFAALVGLFVWRTVHGADLSPPASPRALAPSFALPDLDGRTRSLESFRGRPVLVNFWATWCPPCRAELPELQQTWRAHQSCLAVVGVTEDSASAEAVRAFAREMGLDYPILLDDGSAGRAYGVTTIPRSVLIDAEGRVMGTFAGTVTRAGVERALAAVSPPVC